MNKKILSKQLLTENYLSHKIIHQHPMDNQIYT